MTAYQFDAALEVVDGQVVLSYFFGEKRVARRTGKGPLELMVSDHLGSLRLVTTAAAVQTRGFGLLTKVALPFSPSEVRNVIRKSAPYLAAITPRVATNSRTSDFVHRRDRVELRSTPYERRRGLLLLTGFMYLATVQFAECSAAPPDITLGAFADSLGTVKRLDLHALDAFDVHLVAVNATMDTVRVNAWSVRLAGAAANPPGGAQLTSVALAGPSPLNIGTYPNFEVGLGGCIPLPPESSMRLATLTFETTTEFDGGIVWALGTNSERRGSLGMCDGEVRMVYRANLNIFMLDGGTGKRVAPRATKTWFVGRGRVLEFVTPFDEHSTLPNLPGSQVSLSVSRYYLGNGPAEIAVHSAGGIRVSEDRMWFVRGYGARTHYPLPHSEIIFVASEPLARHWNYEPRPHDSPLYRLEEFYVLDRATPSSELQPFTQEDVRATSGVPIPQSLSENRRTAIPPGLLSQTIVPLDRSVDELVSSLVARFGRDR